MRLISVTAVDVEAKRHAWLFKQVRAVVLGTTLGDTLNRIRNSQPLFDLETDCENACEALGAVIGFVSLLSEQGIVAEISQLERLPQPMDGPPPRPAKKTIAVGNLQATLEFEESIQFRGWPDTLRAYIDRLQKADWTLHLGEPIDDDSVVTGKRSDLPTSNWLDVILESQNRLTETLCYDHPYHYKRNFQPLVESLEFQPLVADKLRGVGREFRDSELLARSLALVIHQACLEVYYCNLVPEAFGANWASWLLRGRLPCGWRGKGDGGRLIVA